MVRKVLLSAKNIHKSYTQGAGELPILKGLSFQIHEGEAIGIVGSSGSGKTTLLQILGTLDRPLSGELKFEDMNLLTMSDGELSQFRNQTMGFVFQFHHLMTELTALENVMLPCRIGGLSVEESEASAQDLLTLLGLADRASHYPNQLSGGELQRVAIARALVRKPKILFADEPTGNLDSTNSGKIQDIFFLLKEKFNLSLIVVTHDLSFAQRFPRVLRLKDGQWFS